jgi:hypothetical protein
MMNADNIVNEPAEEWGGKWTEKKLEAFVKYVRSYLIIMNKSSYWKTIYFDGFAGSGTRALKSNPYLLEQLSLTEEEQKVYKGAAERVLEIKDLGFRF